MKTSNKKISTCTVAKAAGIVTAVGLAVGIVIGVRMSRTQINA